MVFLIIIIITSQCNPLRDASPKITNTNFTTHNTTYNTGMTLVNNQSINNISDTSVGRNVYLKNTTLVHQEEESIVKVVKNQSTSNISNNSIGRNYSLENATIVRQEKCIVKMVNNQSTNNISDTSIGRNYYLENTTLYIRKNHLLLKMMNKVIWNIYKNIMTMKMKITTMMQPT